MTPHTISRADTLAAASASSAARASSSWSARSLVPGLARAARALVELARFMLGLDHSLQLTPPFDPAAARARAVALQWVSPGRVRERAMISGHS